MFILTAAYLVTRKSETASYSPESAGDRLNRYEFDLSFDPMANQLSVSMNLTVTNRDNAPFDELIIRTYAGAFEREDTSPVNTAELRDTFYPAGFSSGGIELSPALWNGQTVSSGYEDKARTVLRVDIPSLDPGATGMLTMKCVILLPQSPGRFGVWEDVWRFGNALPVLALRENGAWRKDPYYPVGDPFVSEAANYFVRIKLPSGYSLAASAPLDRENFALRDFTLVIMKENSFSLRTFKADDTLLMAWAKDGEQAEKLLKTAREAYRFFEDWMGPYPWETLTIIELPFPMGGMEYQSLVMITDAYAARNDDASLAVSIAHELAHQWFYALVGSDQVNEPWQDEALSEYATIRFINKRFGNSAALELRLQRRSPEAQLLSPSRSILRFPGYMSYTASVYGRAVELLFALDERTGKTAAFVESYVKRFAFGYATRKGFEQALDAFMGDSLGVLVSEYLDAPL